jgi:hypothetical protein
MSDEPVKVGKWQRRLLLVTLPSGIVLLILWVGWMVVALASGGVEAWWWGTPILGLVTSLILIATGYNYRRILAR